MRWNPTSTFLSIDKLLMGNGPVPYTVPFPLVSSLFPMNNRLQTFNKRIYKGLEFFVFDHRHEFLIYQFMECFLLKHCFGRVRHEPCRSKWEMSSNRKIILICFCLVFCTETLLFSGPTTDCYTIDHSSQLPWLDWRTNILPCLSL